LCSRTAPSPLSIRISWYSTADASGSPHRLRFAGGSEYSFLTCRRGRRARRGVPPASCSCLLLPRPRASHDDFVFQRRFRTPTATEDRQSSRATAIAQRSDGRRPEQPVLYGSHAATADPRRFTYTVKISEVWLTPAAGRCRKEWVELCNAGERPSS
jgi:hypothetical protein